MNSSLAVLFSFNEAVLMVIVFIILFGLPLFAIFKRMKMEDRRLAAGKKGRRKPPPSKTIESRPTAPPPSPTSTPEK